MMTWTRMLEIEMQRIRAQETTIEATLKRVHDRAEGAETKNVIEEMLDSIPGRVVRIEMLLELGGWVADSSHANDVLGWQADMEYFVSERQKSPVIDAMILAFILKATRARTSCFEAAYLLSKNLGAEAFSRLLMPMWEEDREFDARLSNDLAGLIAQDGDYWEKSFGLV